MRGLEKTSQPGTPFVNVKEVDELVRKARGKSSPGNDGVSYRVYKKRPLLRKNLFTRSMTKKEGS